MAPTGSRKRVKSIPSVADSQSSNDGTTLPSKDRGRSGSLKQGGSGNWYPGAWPVSKSSKAAPVTEVARESISVAQNVASSLTSSPVSQLASPKHPRNPSLQLTRKVGASTRSLPANATTTRINIASDGTASSPAIEAQPNPTASATESINKESSNDEGAGTGGNIGNDQSNVETETNAGSGEVETSQEQTLSQPSGWFSWVWPPSRIENPPDSFPEDSTPAPVDQAAENQTSKEEDAAPANQGQAEETKPPETAEIDDTAQKRSWLQMWYGSSSSKGLEEPHRENPPAADGPTPPADTPPTSNENVNEPIADIPADAPAKSAKPSGWSFWFRETSQDASPVKSLEVQSVEASTAQDSIIKKPNDDPESEPEQKVELSKKGTLKIKSPKSSSVLPEQAVSGPDSNSTASAVNTSEATASKHLQKILPNQVLPRFRDTFALQEKPSLLQSIGRFLHYSKEPDNRHVYMIKDPPPIKRALAIGIHGYFPAPLIRTVLGQPTGTSIRFSNMAADALKNWADDHAYTCDIEKIALEGEGRIAERVDLLWKLLLNWMEKIRQADFLLIACHSQGVPVAIMLVAKLISFGCLNAARVGICAMAGVNMGPFSDYRSRWISGSAGELFEFALPHSQVSKDYEAALRASLDFGVRISYIGSIDDQLVSLESSLFSPMAHPYIYRAVFVDGRVHAPSFLSHLVGFALKLRNLGLPDHGLIRELSSPLAGSLYSGDGHSRLYDDEAVYRLAIEFALETSNVQDATLSVKRSPPASSVNPYILPFAMRGLLEEEYVRRELYEETMELLRQFDDWKPTSKVLKDVKFRLEGIRSKL
ncbi:hypothetical protein BDV32DRAFT_63661 [Aspergillus pseudonomiae]|uniref:YMC020W-like alpha/beta hydrolase domain-containing protein n=1 Tax=Aspergillus pseudonomiae TaxID=1506151 RepID=A0A5N6I1M1_9EURO|nr:uncharacterized protein BDV37DRAFT_206973 [Aspergillus pseudonomiae]KAB8258933.1 hypothetical protein BDV32DRAFT_63661 [Aspergillus pseudonomiae]KAE8408000.1 hypothetical protein BDV37DRAFT_206973 [Aspergillus pseudonomiae]